MSNNPYTTFDKARMSPGINEGVVIKEMRYDATDKYEACSITFAKGEAEITDKIFPPNPAWITPFENETPEAALNREWGAVNSKLKSIVLNFVDDATFQDRISKANPDSFKAAVDFYVSLLPANYAEIKGRLFTWYKKNGYLEVPRLTKSFKGNKLFTTDPDVDMSLARPVDESKLVRPGVTADTTPDTASTEVAADDMPWK